MKKSSLLWVFVIFLLVSCKGLSPFFDGNRTRALGFCGDEGELVVYMELRGNGDFISLFTGSDFSAFSRFRDIVAVITSDGIYGIIEGDVPMVAKKIIIKQLGARKVVSDGISHYQADMDGKLISFDLVYPGVLLFSFADYSVAYRTFVSEQKQKISQPISSFMQNHDISLYGIRPSNDTSDMFKASVMKGTTLTMDYDKKNMRIVLNGIMQFTGLSAFNAMKVSMQNDMLKYMKNSNMSKMELINAMRSARFSEEDFSIVYDNYSMPIDMFKNMFIAPVFGENQ